MATLSLKLPDNLNNELQATSEQMHTTRSELMRRALEFYLENRKQRRSEPGSFLSAAQDLCGKYSGPEDLSTNPTHMEDYGE